MKYLQRYLLLLLALALSLGTFSITANAAEIEDTSTLKINFRPYIGSRSASFGQLDIMDGQEAQKTMVNSISFDYGKTYNAFSEFILVDTSGKPLMNSDKKYTFQAYNLHFWGTIAVNDGDLEYKFLEGPQFIYEAYVIYVDGTREDISDVHIIHNSTTGTFDLKFSFVPSKDVYKVFIKAGESFNPSDGHYWVSESNFDVTFLYGTNELAFGVSVQSEEAGLLEGIKNGISNLWSAITDGFSNVVNKLSDGFSSVVNKLTDGFDSLWSAITNVFNAILDLPAKIWEFMENGLKSLFVPSEETMASYKDKWDELLASRFGAVYQVVNILTDSWDGVMQADETDTIEFPSATINFSGTPFTFGGYTVKIVPDGFSALVSAVKIIVGIVCTIAFINGLRKRYDEIMGVEQ